MNNDFLRYFPKKSCYPNQLEAINAINEALIKKQIVLFEGACGTGKTLSAIAPALNVAQTNKKTVVIATSVHQQMYQHIEEAKEIKKKTDIKVIVFKGKMEMCPHPGMNYDKCNILTENTFKLRKLEEELEFLKEQIYNNDNNSIENKKKLSSEIENLEKSLLELRKNSCDKLLELRIHDKGFFYDWIFNSVRTPEEIKEWASLNNCCGYELLKRFMKEVDLLLCNYNHFINEGYRTNVLNWLGKRLDDIILIFDEAHNLEENARKNSPKLMENDLIKAIDEIYSKKHPLFCWDEVPGKDDDKLKKLIADCFDIDWVGIPTIIKSDDGGSINITDLKTNLKFELDTSNNEVKLIFDNIKYKFYFKIYGNQLNIFKYPEPPKEFGIALSVLLDTMRSTYNDKIKSRSVYIGNKWHDFRIADPELEPKKRIDTFKIKLMEALEHRGIMNSKEIFRKMKDFSATIDELDNQVTKEKNHIKKRSKLSHTADFLSYYMSFSNNIDYYPILSVCRMKNEISGRLELYSCIPKNITESLFDGVHSAVLMSATLTPFEAIKNTLGIRRETHELVFGLTFPTERRLSIAVPIKSLTNENRKNPKTIENIIEILKEIIEQSEGNVLIFFPTADEASKYKTLLDSLLDSNITILIEEKGIPSQKVRDEFYRIGDSGKKSVLISYIGGTLTEGVDYKDKRCRTVVIVGIGYPNIYDDRKLAVESTYEEAFGDGWKYAFTIPTIRKVRQAMGRVIRSGDDYGVRVLLDERYTSGYVKGNEKYSVFNIFPEEERAEIIDVEPNRVKYSIMNFFNNIRKLKNQPFIEEMENLQKEHESLNKYIEDIEKNNVILNDKLRLYETEFNNKRFLFEAKEKKEFFKGLVHKKETLQIENEQLKLSKKQIETFNAPYECKINIMKGEFKKIEKSMNDLNSYIQCVIYYKANRKTIENYPKYYSSIAENAKKYGILGKSSSELQNLIEIKENELNSIKKRESELRLNIEKENDFLNENSAHYSKCIEEMSSNEKRIVELDFLLNSIDIQKIEKIDEKILESLENNELISNLKKVRLSIEENNTQLLDYRKKKSLIDKRINEINNILGSSDLAKCQISSEAYVNY
ncbi:MAG: helicase C-terminal domain-containing protein [Candidatus Methanoperedens sp.]|nr:helicase C-terminal domain-containing protein [Candidatus Methanoperedens sp.]